MLIVRHQLAAEHGASAAAISTGPPAPSTPPASCGGIQRSDPSVLDTFPAGDCEHYRGARGRARPGGARRRLPAA
jgi:hypothetical protein